MCLLLKDSVSRNYQQLQNAGKSAGFYAIKYLLKFFNLKLSKTFVCCIFYNFLIQNFPKPSFVAFKIQHVLYVNIQWNLVNSNRSGKDKTNQINRVRIYLSANIRDLRKMKESEIKNLFERVRIYLSANIRDLRKMKESEIKNLFELTKFEFELSKLHCILDMILRYIPVMLSLKFLYIYIINIWFQEFLEAINQKLSVKCFTQVLQYFSQPHRQHREQFFIVKHLWYLGSNYEQIKGIERLFQQKLKKFITECSLDLPNRFEKNQFFQCSLY
eukprot:TRINITY_DN27219_c0_g1_i3.p1 TRINITY_DN27219_c0_g1~~TRINITY_DN27219_c0_g1_i3.p1  ORF type:complete len:273 (-),score=-4.06 TRINITY_DN27219_c0_g1_i3:128-946(-)